MPAVDLSPSDLSTLQAHHIPDRLLSLLTNPSTNQHVLVLAPPPTLTTAPYDISPANLLIVQSPPQDQQPLPLPGAHNIAHADDANCVLLPLTHVTLCWPTRNIYRGEPLTRDWAPHLKRGSRRRTAYLLAMLDLHQGRFALAAEEAWNHAFLSQALGEPLAVLGVHSPVAVAPWPVRPALPLPVACYSDDRTMRAYLASSACSSKLQPVPSPATAAVVYSTLNTRFPREPGSPVLNQFPREAVLVCKDLLVQLSRSCVPSCTPLSYDCDTELHHVLARPFACIVKPARQTRGQGHVLCLGPGITPRLLAAASADGCVAQAYVARPLLLAPGHKFDVRTLVLVDQFRPCLVAWANLPASYARVAAARFLPCSEDVRVALTVTRYVAATRDEDAPPPLVSRDALRVELGPARWDAVEAELLKQLSDLFCSAGHCIGPAESSRGALYGVDWLVQEDFCPTILEVNFCPDLTAASLLNPADVFLVMAGHSPAPSHWTKLMPSCCCP